MRFVSFLFISGLCLCGSFAAMAQPFSLPDQQEKYLSELQNRAEKSKLYKDDRWRALLHYHKRLFSAESTIDTESFFLDKNGKYDLKAEMNATLRAFFTPKEKIKSRTGESPDYRHPLCLYPARYAFLKKNLNIDETALPKVDCKEYNETLKKLDAKKLTLIYTSAYMGNPASLLGHTLLRVDSKEDLPLLAHAVNYGAITGNDNALAFMIKGIWGGYPGVFSLTPYYDTVNTYNNMENRDIWEYRLNLTQEQLNSLVAHVWEAGQTSADYYFFSENCSYILLEMLDVALPNANMAQQFYKPYFFMDYVIPVDTIRTVLKQNNVLDVAVYRPSRQTKLKNAYSHLNDSEKEQLRKVLHAPRNTQSVMASDLSPSQKANVLETAYEFLQYEYLARHIGIDEMRTDTIKLLKARSSIPEKSTIPPVPTPAKRPDQGHNSAATGIFVGRRNDENFIDYNIRLAYHALMDNSEGYLPFTEITYMDTDLRWYERTNDLRLQQLKLVNIRSLAPRNELFKPLSFQFKTGAERYQHPGKEKEGTVFFADGGIGASFEFLPNTVFFTFANLHLKSGGYLPHNGFVGAGAQAGIFSDLGKVRILAQSEYVYASDKTARELNCEAEIGYSLTTNLSVIAKWSYKDRTVDDIRETKIGLQYLF